MAATWRVLVADDSDFMRAMIIKRLTGSEFAVAGEAKTGSDAVARYQELKPDVLLLDIVMGDQVGTKTLSEILVIDPKARVIFVSSVASERMIEECLMGGAKRFLPKPFEREQLLEVLRDVVKS